MSHAEDFDRKLTSKGAVIAEIVKGNPGKRLKAIDYDSFGSIRRIEWHDDEDSDSGGDPE